MNAGLERALGNGQQIPLHGSILPLELFAVVGQHVFYRSEQSLTHVLEVAVWSQGQHHLVPQEIRAGNLSEDAGRRLKYNGIRKGHHSPRRRVRRSSPEFHHLYAHQSYVHNFARHAADLHSIAHANPVPPDQEEVAHYGHNHVLQSHGNARREQARIGHRRLDPAGKSQSHDDNNGEGQGDFAQQQKLIPPMRLVYVAIDRSLSDFRKNEDNSDEYAQDGQPRKQAPQQTLQVASYLVVPVLEALLVQPEQDALLAQGNGNRGQLFEFRRQRIYLLLLLGDRRCALSSVCRRIVILLVQFVGLPSQFAQASGERRSQISGSFGQCLRLRDGCIDGAKLPGNFKDLLAQPPYSAGLAAGGLSAGSGLIFRVCLVASRSRCRNRRYRRRQGIDLSPQPSGLTSARPGHEFHHAVDGVPASFFQVKFALCSHDLRLQKLALSARGCGNFLSQGIQLGFGFPDLLVGRLLGFEQSLLLRCACILGLDLFRRRACRQSLRLCAGKIEAESDNLCLRLAIVADHGHFARIVRNLLVQRHLPIPRQRLLEERNNLGRIQRTAARVLLRRSGRILRQQQRAGPHHATKDKR